ncbi:hypothetical protein [Thioalkalivibrio sp. ALE20]|uniref:PFGI-1 class ICE element type IV pilus protein PilL2 n=1 Tax=Thioalkalivibrio sp. ALE20 TaxID=545275 RepID=UPI0003A7C1B1|nr:hypothetical protein [Thioalkalivibrio sp. ALE20]
MGRYLSAPNAPTHAQAEPLQVKVKVSIPSSAEHVGGALKHVLARSGYRLQDVNDADPAMRVLLTRPLPQVHRELGPMSLEQVLTTLAGDPWRLVVDPTSRLVTFEPREPYAEAARTEGRAIPDDEVRAALGEVDPHARADREQYGPVEEGETLVSIARGIHPGTPHRTAAALFEANPDAFFPRQNPSPDRLRTGVNLDVPDREDVAQWTVREAKSILGAE